MQVVRLKAASADLAQFVYILGSVLCMYVGCFIRALAVAAVNWLSISLQQHEAMLLGIYILHLLVGYAIASDFAFRP